MTAVVLCDIKGAAATYSSRAAFLIVFSVGAEEPKEKMLNYAHRPFDRALILDLWS